MVWRIHRAEAGLGARARVRHVERLKDLAGGMSLPNPVGLPRGFDKKRQPPSTPLSNAGFGFIEVGGARPAPARQ